MGILSFENSLSKLNEVRFLVWLGESYLSTTFFYEVSLGWLVEGTSTSTIFDKELDTLFVGTSEFFFGGLSWTFLAGVSAFFLKSEAFLVGLSLDLLLIKLYCLWISIIAFSKAWCSDSSSSNLVCDRRKRS